MTDETMKSDAEKLDKIEEQIAALKPEAIKTALVMANRAIATLNSLGEPYRLAKRQNRKSRKTD
jgi:hypothetical protein